jgi:hypothetical protein
LRFSKWAWWLGWGRYPLKVFNISSLEYIFLLFWSSYTVCFATASIRFHHSVWRQIKVFKYSKSRVGKGEASLLSPVLSAE